MDCLQMDLINPVGCSIDTVRNVIGCLWQTGDNSVIRATDLHAFAAYYITQFEHSLNNQGRRIAIRKHIFVIEICRLLLANRCREDIRIALCNGATGCVVCSEVVARNTIDLAVRMCFMINVDNLKRTFTPGRTQIGWTSGEPRYLLLGIFKHQRALGDIHIRLEKTFTAHSIQIVAGIQIRWTDNLADHLRILDSEDKVVALFHHASFLKYQSSTLYPGGLLEGTLKTLTLLLPQYDKSLQKWLSTQIKCSAIDSQLASLGHLSLDERQLNAFHFWHDRLTILKQA